MEIHVSPISAMFRLFQSILLPGHVLTLLIFAIYGQFVLASSLIPSVSFCLSPNERLFSLSPIQIIGLPFGTECLTLDVDHS